MTDAALPDLSEFVRFPMLSKGLRVAHKFGGEGAVVEYAESLAWNQRVAVLWDRHGLHPLRVPAASLSVIGTSSSFLETYTLFSQRASLYTRISGLLVGGSIEEAKRLYECECVQWWDRDDFDRELSIAGQAEGDRRIEGQRKEEARRAEDNRLQKERELAKVKLQLKVREERREKAKAEVLQCLQKDDLDSADRLYEERCAEWWNAADYRGHRDRSVALVREKKEAADKRASVISRLQTCFCDDYLASDTVFRNEGSDVLTEMEYGVLKRDFVRVWLESNLNVPSDQCPDDEQMAAIAAVTGVIQVTARAGSGKTTTLIQRTYFLMRHCRVPPDQILLLAFNRSAVLDVRRKLLAILCPAVEVTIAKEIHAARHSIKKRRDREVAAVDRAARIHDVAMPNVMTFHALAYGLVNPSESFLIDSEEDGDFGLSRTMQRVIDDHLPDKEWQPRIRSLMLAHFRNDWGQIERDGFDLPDRGALLEHRRSLARETLRGEYVKSYGEKVIADFLLEHGVPYQYERNHRWSGFNYRPDFTLFRQAGRNASGVIIEYFGLQGEPDYDEQSERKRKYWSEKPEWYFLEFSPEDILREGVAGFRSRLRAALVPMGFPCVPLSEDELWEKVRDRAIRRFTKAIVSFVGRCRTRLVTPEDLDALSDSHEASTDAEVLFIPLVRQFYAEYLHALTMMDCEDFSGVMQRAIAAIRAGHVSVQRGQSVICDLSRLRFVSVDEFQDFSELFYQLVQAVREAGENVNCFCVGDDWQAINGFAGSDLKYFQKFSKYMGASSQLAISTNYRSSESVVAAGNAVMAGQGRPARARSGANRGSVIVANMDDFAATLLEQRKHNGDDISPAVLRIAKRSIEAGRSVVVLCRSNAIPWYVHWEGERGLQAYVARLRMFLPEDQRNQMTVSTAHKFKGLERDDVIVIDAVRRSYPLVHPDWLFSRILGVTIDELVAEERRLFYVAVTRAKGSVILFTDNRNESAFLKDLKARMTAETVIWKEYPPCDVTSAHVVVSVTSRPGCRIANGEGAADAPTYVLRESLKLSGYKFKSGSAKSWEKALPSEGFDVSMLRDELWVRDAHGVEVTVRDGNNRIVESWIVEDGLFFALSV